MLEILVAVLIVIISTFPAQAQERGVVRVLALGDSLTAGYGLSPDQGFVPRLERALKGRGLDVRVINAGVSGDTTRDGLDRLEWALADEPDAAIVELGANDGLRGIDPDLTRANLDAILTMLAGRGVKVLLTGMLAPPNMTDEYAKRFQSVFPRLAKKHGVAFYPFFLQGVAGDPALNQDDGIHPTSQGVDVIVAGILPYVVELVESVD